jgi:hypothetical protein
VSLFKRAPAIEIHAPAVLFAGVPARIEIALDAPEPIDLDWIEARLWGIQGWVVGSGKSRRTSKVRFPDLVNRVAERGRLPAGRTVLETTFTPPPEMPPSHEVEPAYARAYLHVRLSIPWWPDATLRQTIPIRVVGPPSIERTPFVTPRREGARLELALASTRLVAGEPIVGSCAAFQLDDDEQRDVELVLVPRLTLVSWWNDFTRSGGSLVATLTLPPGSGGRSVPFQFPLPPDLTPTFAAKTHALAWQFKARIGGFFGTKAEVVVPLELVDPTTPPAPRAVAVPPLLADERVAAAFQAFAEHCGWRYAIASDDAAEPGIAAGEPFVEREVGDAVVRIGYAYRGTAGAFVLARIEYPSLGLGLVAVPGSALRHVFFEDIEAGIAAWDRAHYVQARFAEQTAPFLRRVVPAAATDAGELVRWDDDAIELASRVTADLTPGQLVALADRLEAIAGAIASARAALEPPPGFVVDHAAWAELARELDGTLAIASLSITGTVGGLPVSLGLAWEGVGDRGNGGEDDGDLDRPEAIRVTVGDPERASAALREVALAMPAPALEALSTPAAEPIAGVLTGWRDDVIELRVTDGVAAAAWQLPPNRVVDAARVHELALGLRAVLAALDPGHGPYR